jgi:hypothetical protein
LNELYNEGHDTKGKWLDSVIQLANDAL